MWGVVCVVFYLLDWVVFGWRWYSCVVWLLLVGIVCWMCVFYWWVFVVVVCGVGCCWWGCVSVVVGCWYWFGYFGDGYLLFWCGYLISLRLVCCWLKFVFCWCGRWSGIGNFGWRVWCGCLLCGFCCWCWWFSGWFVVDWIVSVVLLFVWCWDMVWDLFVLRLCCWGVC